MPWLLREGDVLAAVEDRRKGWQASLQGAVVIEPPAFVQTVTASPDSGLDVAWCRPTELEEGRTGYAVRRMAALPARRWLLPRLGRGALVVAPGGSFERWRLQVGDKLEVRGS
jgi:hypothetical protein